VEEGRILLEGASSLWSNEPFHVGWGSQGAFLVETCQGT